jgi:hypothetical protein
LQKILELWSETMTVVQSTPNFTEVPLKPVSNTGSNVTETMVNFMEVPLKPVSNTRSNVTETMVNPIMDAFKILFGGNSIQDSKGSKVH